MALIECPECARQISDTAPGCPHCGYVLKQQANSNSAQGSRPSPNQHSTPTKPAKKSRFGVGTLILILLVLGWVFADKNDSNSKAHTGNAANQTPSLSMTAEKLFSAYDANEVRADSLYDGLIIRVSGVVRDIGIDVLGSPYVTLEVDNTFSSVQCMFDKKDSGRIGAISKGQSFSAICTCKGKTLGNVLMDDCRL